MDSMLDEDGCKLLFSGHLRGAPMRLVLMVCSAPDRTAAFVLTTHCRSRKPDRPY